MSSIHVDMSIQMTNSIREYIENLAVTYNVSECFNGEKRSGKYLANAHIVVKVCINCNNEGFWNGDICEILADMLDGTLLVMRLTDKHEGIVDKSKVQYPSWGKYPF